MTMNLNNYGVIEEEYIRRNHKHAIVDRQCTSVLIKHIKAPLLLVWSLVRRFDEPQKYKPFISRCVVQGNFEIGSVREVGVKSGLPATTSSERLELLDDSEHVLSIRIVGGDHRLKVSTLLSMLMVGGLEWSFLISYSLHFFTIFPILFFRVEVDKSF
ncbi:hypothetical protein RND81_14G103600 [Saponaria officinalis]|uniref:Uncharacterized protein n=1 Tax=Saponaria officinalis TaxID=3572 RepID=A0AAW1GNS6_SAPOF